MVTGLVVRRAAERFDPDRHGPELDRACAALKEAAEQDENGAFNRARRQFYRLLLVVGGNHELQRLFPAIGMHIIYAQYASERLRDIRLTDYQLIAKAVERHDISAAEQAAVEHIEKVAD